VIAGSRSVRLVLGTIPLLIIAGLVEGFISPSGISPAAQGFCSQAFLPALLILYLNKKPSSAAALSAVPATGNSGGLK